MGARGNSGVILSQIVRGAAEKVATPPGRLIDPELIEAALTNAADRAYASVREPAEGTMLTVIRAMADAVAERRAQWLRERLDPDASEAEQNALLAEMLATALFAGEEAVRHTPEQLDVLAEAGVVDAGALGLVVIIRGMIAGLAGEQVQLPEIPHYAAARLDQVHHADSAYRYCTNFIVTGDGLDGRLVRARARGGSATRCSWSATRRRSRSTSTPTTPTRRRRSSTAPARSATSTSPTCTSRSPASGRGSAPARSGVVAVASGDGMRSAVRGARRARRRRRADAQPVDQGPARRRSRPAAPTRCSCCRTRRNVLMAAEEAARLAAKSGREVVVAASDSQQGGLAALVEFDPDDDADANAQAPRAPGSRRSGSARSRRRPATTPRGASAAATRSASPTTRSSPGAAPGRP